MGLEWTDSWVTPPNNSHLLVFIPLYNPLPLSVGGIRDLLLTKNMANVIGYQSHDYVITHMQRTRLARCIERFSCLKKQAAML